MDDGRPGPPTAAGAGTRRARVRRRVIVYGLLLVMLPLIMALPGVADRVVLFPSTGPADAMGARRHEVPFEGGVLEIWIARSPGAARPEGPTLYVLSFEGNASRAEWAAAPDAHLWGKHAVEVWSVNYPGYGGSTGPARLKRLPPAALAAYDALAVEAARRPILDAAAGRPIIEAAGRPIIEAARRPIIVNGSSIGSTLALYVASRRPVAGALLRNPPPLRELILSPRQGWWNLWVGSWIVAWKIPREMNSLLNAPRVTAPGAFVLSTADEVVPPRLQERIVEAYAGEKTRILLPGASHNAAFDGSRRAELQAACEWLWQRCPAR